MAYTIHMSVPTHTTARCSISLQCLPSIFFISRIEEQQNVRQPHGTTWLNHSYYTGIQPSALRTLQQLQAGASSSSPVQTLASAQESNGTASSSFVFCPQITHSAISPQVLAGPTRNVTGDVMSATLAEDATQLSFADFLERCNL